MRESEDLTTSPGDDPLHDVAPAEMAALIRALAASVAEYRAHFGEIQSARDAAGADDAAITAVINAALAGLREAPRAIGEGAASPASSGEDLRRQYRINIDTPVTLCSAQDSRRVAATLRNISWGGALVRSAAFTAGAGDAVRLLLPSGHRTEIPVQGAVLRVHDYADSREFALRFDSISPDDEPRFRRVLEILLAHPDGEGRRSESRLVQRLEIEYGDAGELRATLEDISAGGLRLIVPDPLELQQSLLIVLSSADSPHTLELRARVVHQTCMPGEEVDLYRVGLAFEHPSPELRERVGTLIHELVVDQPALHATATPIDPYEAE
ncbi:MAG: PilZ domain-containing protein [Gammaproteobacteria bacterium]